MYAKLDGKNASEDEANAIEQLKDSEDYNSILNLLKEEEVYLFSMHFYNIAMQLNSRLKAQGKTKKFDVGNLDLKFDTRRSWYTKKDAFLAEKVGEALK